MCGRFSVSNPRRVYDEFSLVVKQPALEPRYNIAPSQGVWAIRVLVPNGERRLDLLRWGFVAKNTKNPHGVIMARAESVAVRAPLAAAFRGRRCLLVADGFYEWRRTGKQSLPYDIHRPGRAPFGMAAIWEPRVSSDSPGALDSCAIITRPARDPVSAVHDRMPAILAREHHDAWLDPGFTDVAALKEMLLSEPGAELEVVPIGPRVNSPANDDPDCLAPSRHEGEQLGFWRG